MTFKDLQKLVQVARKTALPKNLMSMISFIYQNVLAVELALAKAQEEDSVFRIRSSKDVCHVLTDKETLEKVLQQGLKEEHMQYKERIVELFTSMKDRIKVEDLTVN